MSNIPPPTNVAPVGTSLNAIKTHIGAKTGSPKENSVNWTAGTV